MRTCALIAMLTPMLAIAGTERLVEGEPASPVRVIVFEDLQCPDCAAFRVMLDEKLLPKYRAAVAFEHRDFPLAKHAWARKAAIASRFFQGINPDLAFKYRRETMASLKATTADNFNERLAAFAQANEIDPLRAVAALEDPQLAAAVEKDVQEGVARGVAHTPTAIVNGTPFVETITFEEISKAIDTALVESRK
jgi:protein-disulfide isomerase